jgi:polysaccharide biosynthesis transport protein
MDIRQFTKLLQRWWWLIVIGTAAAAVISFFATRATPNTYQSRTTLLVGQALQDPNVNTNEIGTSQTLADVYAGFASREPVLRGTLRELNLNWNWESLRERVTTRVPPNSSLIELSVVDTDPQRAQVFADTIARQLVLQSPAANNPERDADREFIQRQLGDLRDKVTVAETEIQKLNDEINQAQSARDIDEKRRSIRALEEQITSWQGTYARLQSNLLQGAPNVITVIEPAALPTVPIGPRLTQNVLLAALVGLVVSLAIAFLLEVIDDTIKTTEDAHKVTGLSVLGSVAHLRGADYPSKLVTARTDSNRDAEAFRVLRTNLQFSAIDKPFHTLMVTSTRPKEGKSVTAANLATVIAQSGKRTVLVDCDLRRPTQHEVFELANDRGFTTLFLEEGTGIDDVVCPIASNLSVIPSGPIPHNAAELLDSARMNQQIERLKSRFDTVVFDVPPVLSVADATILAAKVDAVMMVVDSNFTRRGQAKRAKETLASVGANILGVVVNRVSETSEEDYYYDYSSKRSGVSEPRKTGLAGLIQRMGKSRKGRKPTPFSATSMPRPAKLTKPVAKLEPSATNGHAEEEKVA